MENDARIEDGTRPRSDSDIGAADIASYVSALAFSRIALPSQLSDAVRRSIEALAERERELSGPANAESAVRDAREKREKESDDHKENQVSWIQIEQQRQQEQEREQWARASHSFAGQTLTGQEWGAVANDLKSGAARQWLLDYLIQHGQTREEAERTAKDMQLAASGLSKPEFDRTKDEKAAMQRIEANPQAADAFTHYLEQKEQGFATTAAHSAQATSGSRTVSVEARADALSDFAAAPDLSAHHRAALAATNPLDGPASQTAALRTPAPQPAMNAGLDI